MRGDIPPVYARSHVWDFNCTELLNSGFHLKIYSHFTE